MDIYVRNLKTIIEIDGPFTLCTYMGEERLQKQVKADEQKSGLALSRGFAIVIRVRHMQDSQMCLVDRENLKNSIVELLKNFKVKFPPRSKRYIEIEV